MARLGSSTLEEFSRALDAMFDEVLIGPWRSRRTVHGAFLLIDQGDRYQLTIDTGHADPAELDLEVTPTRVLLSCRSDRAWQQSVALPTHVDRDRVTARWARGRLIVELPKTRGRRP